MSMKRRLRFVLATPICDGHDVAVVAVTRLLRSRGVEAVYLGFNKGAREIVKAAVEEDAAAIALSSYNGGHMSFLREVMKEKKKQGIPEVPVFCGGGGTILAKEAGRLERMGVTKLYRPPLDLAEAIGDMIRRTIELAAEMGIGHKVLFTGFLRGEDVHRVFRMADLYVMPSVSEPFGLAPLEALSHDVPVIISKQSGVAEVLRHVLKVDFWDVHEMANKIIAVLRHPPLQATLREHAGFEVRRFSWTDSANQCLGVYHRVTA